MDRIIKIKNGFHRQKLKEISSALIEAYGKRDKKQMLSYVLEKESSKEKGLARLFKSLIFTYHPDRHSYFQASLDKFSRKPDHEIWNKLEIILNGRNPGFKENDYEAFEGFADLFASGPPQDESAADGWSDDDCVLSEMPPGEYGFIEAVKNLMYGNLFVEFLPKDLLYMEGLLTLAEEGIADLEGIEYCRHITALNLEGNRIDKLSGLGELTNLESLYLGRNWISDLSPLASLRSLDTLDLAYNDIESVSDLAGLENLKYLNLIGNFVGDLDALDGLRDRCLIICDSDGGKGK